MHILLVLGGDALNAQKLQKAMKFSKKKAYWPTFRGTTKGMYSLLSLNRSVGDAGYIDFVVI